jgi:type IV secretory pathway TraG/TraD family ATPase VirD4
VWARSRSILYDFTQPTRYDRGHIIVRIIETSENQATTVVRRTLISARHSAADYLCKVKTRPHFFSAIANYLQPFITPEIAQVFCAAGNSFEFADLDRGKIVCVAMPQKFQMERRYVNTFLKMLFYTHALRRFDKPTEERQRDNLLVLWADEAQRFVTASEDGMSDYNCIDVIREARATVVAAAQSSTSFIPPLGREKARVFTLNLRNRLIFKAADEEGAVESADFLGKKRVIKKSWGYHSGTMSRNYSEQEEHKIKPHLLRNLPKHVCVLVYSERGHRKRLLSPLEANGSVSPWFRRWSF